MTEFTESLVVINALAVKRAAWGEVLEYSGKQMEKTLVMDSVNYTAYRGSITLKSRPKQPRKGREVDFPNRRRRQTLRVK